MPAVAPSPAQRIQPGLVLIFAFALRVVALDRLGLAYDEAASALMARATPWEIIAFHWNAAFEHPPLWVLLLNVWSRVAGQSEFALRLLPAFAGTLLVVMVWRLVRLIWPSDPILPTVSALLVALAPVLVYYSQEARMYTLVVLLFLVSTFILLRFWLQPAWKFVLAYWLIAWIMLGMHYYTALAIVIQAAVLGMASIIARRSRQIPLGKLFMAFVGASLPVVAWMLLSPGFQTTLSVVIDKAGENPVTWQYFLGDLWRELTFGSIRWQPDYATWGYAIAPLVLLGAFLAAVRSTQSSLQTIGAWFFIAIVLLPILSGTIALRTLVPRYILWVVPLFYTLAAIAISFFWRRHWVAGLAFLLIILSVDILALQYYFGPYRKSEYREMTRYLQSRGNPQQEIILLEAPRQHLLAKYYLSASWEIHPMPTLPLPNYWPVTAPLLVPEDEDDRIQTWLARYNGLWASYSSEAEVDRGEFLAKYLTAVSYREQCTQWLDVRLCHYVSPHYLSPSQFSPPPTLFGDELAITGASGALYDQTPDATSLLLQIDWHAQQKPTLDYKVSLRLMASDGSTLVEANDFPIGPLLPPTAWNIDDRKPGYFALRIPADLAPGRYPIQISLYDANSLAPTPSIQKDAASTTTQPLTLAELQVGDTMELLAPSEQ